MPTRMGYQAALTEIGRLLDQDVEPDSEGHDLLATRYGLNHPRFMARPRV